MVRQAFREPFIFHQTDVLRQRRGEKKKDTKREILRLLHFQPVASLFPHVILFLIPVST